MAVFRVWTKARRYRIVEAASAEAALARVRDSVKAEQVNTKAARS